MTTPRAHALTTLLAGVLATVAIAVVLRPPLGLGELFIVKSTAAFAVVMLFAIGTIGRHHPFTRFGPANHITTVRVLLVALVVGAIGEFPTPAVAAAAAAGGTLATLLDGVDGWAARRWRTESAFGARFDMEVDALLILALSILAWELDKAGWWVVASGCLRYGFVAAGWVWPWLARPLPPSRRRQTICVVQVVGLLLVLSPIVPRPASAWLAGWALAALGVSFFVDIVWLRRHAPELSHSAIDGRAGRAAVLVGSLFLLNGSLTFRNVWPTPMIRWSGDLSVELAATVLTLACLVRFLGRPSRRVLAVSSGLWLFFVIGHYADVTAPALYGREVNLYWDARFVPDVAVLLARAGPRWAVVAVIAGAVGVLALLYALLRWALERVMAAMANPPERRVLTVLTSAVVIVFLSGVTGYPVPIVTFAAPVISTYARQVQLVAAGLTGSTSLAASPSLDSDLTRIRGTDVFLIFLESYGAVTFDRPEFAATLSPLRTAFVSAIRASHRDVVSAFVESPTFGGSSWLAHISLMSGVEVRRPDTNALLMTQRRETLVTTFARHGYRTVGLMPGLWQRWPEGAFYGFDDILGGARLDYHGPEFGWFDLTDQFALARLDALEVRRTPRKPLFVFFPTISTHTPFTPTPPYQPDWSRMLTDEPYAADDLQRAYARQPDWLDLGPSYVGAVAYAYATLGGYLREHAERDLLVVLMGDHQPPALVSGEGAPWDVPVHVIASRPDVLERLRAHGFTPGIEPARPVLSRMHALLATLLDAFGDRTAAVQ